MLCAVLDPRNLTFPEVNTTDKSVKPTAFGIYLQKGKHQKSENGSEGEDDESSEEEENRRRIEGYKVIFIYYII